MSLIGSQQNWTIMVNVPFLFQKMNSHSFSELHHRNEQSGVFFHTSNNLGSKLAFHLVEAREFNNIANF